MEQHDNGARKDLVKYRIRSAKEDLKSAQILLEAGSLKAANNRAYYAIFHAINAIHALHGAGYKRHKDAIANFNKEYVKTEIFPREIGRRISEAEEIRHASDYDDFYIATVDEAKRQIETADMFLTLVETYCQEQLGEKGCGDHYTGGQDSLMSHIFGHDVAAYGSGGAEHHEDTHKLLTGEAHIGGDRKKDDRPE